MSETVVTTEKPASDLDRLTSLFNEEIYLRVDASSGSVSPSKFKIIDDLIEFLKSKSKLEEAKIKIEEHLKDHPESIFAKYLTGMLALHQNKIEESNHLKNLLDQFRNYKKWPIIEYIADNILQFGDQRIALKFKAEALENLKKNKELKVVLEKLAKTDRKNPEIAKKYALSILEEDREKAILYLKQAAESFAKVKDFDQIDEIWPILIEHNFTDIPFFEKIERILVGHREKTRLVVLLYPLVEPYKKLEDWDKTIYLLKKILDYEPQSPKARNDLIRAYKTKYADHSLLEDFLKMSEIGNNRKPISVCITNFERNIVFDTNNYVLHRSWGVGKITSISSTGDSIFVDFKDKKEHKLSIQMAITSLKPLKSDHILVKYYENSEAVINLFNNDISAFFLELLTSNDNSMSMAEVKSEIIGKFLKKTEDWSKWWSKAKSTLKKEPKIGFNPNKKDEIFYRDKPITLSEQLSERFNSQTEPNKKLEIAMEALKDSTEAEGALELINHFYYEEESSKDTMRKIVAYLFLEESVKELGEDITRLQKESDIASLIRALSKTELLTYSKQITNSEIKKSFVNLIHKFHPENAEILIRTLYEVPVKIHKHVFGVLVNDGKFSELNKFIENILDKSKENPEVFLWVAKSILTDLWTYKEIQVKFSDLVLRVFRLLKPLVKKEEKGMKLKNLTNEILFGDEGAIVKKAIESGDTEYIRKLYALYKEVPYITDSEKKKFHDLINEMKPDFQWDESNYDEDELDDDIWNTIPTNGILVTRFAFNAKKAEFDHLVNVEMAENSRDIGEAQEKGDLRENAEYKAAMERQVQLQAEIKKIESDLKSAIILDIAGVSTDRINVGCTVKLKNSSTGEVQEYSILGPWDADTNKNIISYLSPLGKSLLGKRVGDEAVVSFENHQTN
ncbi:MAG: transcription elongation factor GreA, partial [Leptospiraceae bacterium]|nr:transcription elongation factor GreA [Leptospiraceae bacterium]